MSDAHVQTKSEIRAILTQAGISPRRKWGQNFLIDGNLMRRMLDTAEINGEDVVLEVGIGTGGLTEHLVRAAGAVVAAEIDPVLCRIVGERLAPYANLTIVKGDVLRRKHEIAEGVIDQLHVAREQNNGRLMLVANLPYNIATPLLVELLLSDLGFERFCFTIQREVADRLTAAPNTKAYGPVSVIIQATCEVRRIAVLPPAVFWPAPEVDSTMLRVDVTRNPFTTVEAFRRFGELVRGGFAHRRKTLKHNLTETIGESACHAVSAIVDLSTRPENLSVVEWIEIARRTVR